MTELLPTRARYENGEPVVIEVRGATDAGTLTVWRLGDLVAEHPVTGPGLVDLGVLPAGGYGIELGSDPLVRTAVDVATPNRHRYGFTVDYSPDRDPAGLSDTLRRLHLTDVLFYDWAYRHADLLGGGEQYTDALDQPVSLQTVRVLANAVGAAGSRALGYVAVYAVGPNEWDAWKHQALLTPSGEPYALGDFLFIVDPAAGDWLEHLGAELVASVDSVGFDGFHLDQFGYPHRAVRADGVVVDTAESFDEMITSVRSRLPQARLVFNNVNDFPTWVTAGSPQDAVYIEVWHPTDTIGALAQMVTRARTVAGDKPVVMAAYQHVYDSATAAESDLATAFTMATLYSHGATQLLAGEADRLLVDPYYVRNHTVEASTADLLRRWYDFLVEHDELLVDPAIVDVTASVAGHYNDVLDVSFASASVGSDAVPGTVWRRITRTGPRTVLHLINLVGQTDTLWDAARSPLGDPGAGMLRIRRVGDHVPRVRVADPDGAARLIDLDVTVDGDFAVATLPALAVWQLVLIDDLGVRP
ncbi:hypothetical protein BH10ACT7_BH10ACT7_08190 [soil metagenome]